MNEKILFNIDQSPFSDSFIVYDDRLEIRYGEVSSFLNCRSFERQLLFDRLIYISDLSYVKYKKSRNLVLLKTLPELYFYYRDKNVSVVRILINEENGEEAEKIANFINSMTSKRNNV